MSIVTLRTIESKRKRTVRWAVIGNAGLYIGQWLTKGDAISHHLEVRYGLSLHRNAIGRLVFGPEQAKAWARCKKTGDRAVKVTITWEEP